MKLVIKIGDKYHSDDPRYQLGLRDGQIIDIRPDDYRGGKLERMHHCIFTIPGDYWSIRGSTDWKSTKRSVYDNIKKYLVPSSAGGYYPWDKIAEYEVGRARDWFIDFKWMLEQGFITQGLLEAIYDKDKDPGEIYIGRSLDLIVKNEDVDRKIIAIKNMAVSSGDYTIGAAGDYATVTAWAADLDTQLTGNLRGLHLSEETAISSLVTIATDTNSYLLTLTAQSGAEHNGGAYGNGARVNCGTYDGLYLDEDNTDDLMDVEVSKLAIDASGNGNRGVGIGGMASYSATLLINRMLIKSDGSGDGPKGIERLYEQHVEMTIRNCIIYGFSDSSAFGIRDEAGHNEVVYIYNNTVAKCYVGIQVKDDADPTWTVKNNLCQGNTTDYVNPSRIDTSGYNVSEDATSPDVAYRSLNCHDGNSCFTDYANDDYRLDNGGDEIGTLDDGEDLSGTFTDDIIGTTRSTWYIGAYEIAAAGPAQTHWGFIG